MNAALEGLISRQFPHLIQGKDWFAISFNGKSDLEKNFPSKMRRWGYGDPLFVIMRDNDGGDCRRTKDRLEQLASPANKPFKVRVVVQELESWFLGDSRAVTAAYPHCSFSNGTSKYRDPDRLTNASQELADLTGDFHKVGRATLIAKHLDPDRNVSSSFKVLFDTLQQKLE